MRDLTGVLTAWVDIGLPEPERLHRASKAAPRVAVYTHKDPAQWAVRVREAKIHRAEKLEVFAFDRAWLGGLVARLERRMKFSLARSEAEIYLGLGDETLQTVLVRPLARRLMYRLLTQVLAALHRYVVVVFDLAKLPRKTLRIGEPAFDALLEALRGRAFQRV